MQFVDSIPNSLHKHYRPLAGSAFFIIRESSLTDKTTSAQINTGSTESLCIADTLLLSECGVENICDYLAVRFENGKAVWRA